MAKQQFLRPQGKLIIGTVIIATLSIVGVGVWHVTQLQSSTASTDSEPSPTTRTKTGISALGRIEPQGEVIKVGGPNGERILKLLVREGQQVKVGQPLALLESYPERLAEQGVADSRLREAKELLKSEKLVAQAEILEAQTQFAQATEPIAGEMQAQIATINRLNVEYQRARDDYQRFKLLAAERAVSQKEVYDRFLTQEATRQQLESAKATLQQLQLRQKTDQNNVNAKVQMAKVGLQRSTVQAQVGSASRNLDLAKARLERAVIKAPQTGQVLDVLIKEGEAISVGGGQNGGGGESTILEMGNTRKMVVVAEVYETDIGQVKVGQSATIQSPAIEGKLHGEVQKVGLRIGKKDVLDTDPSADTDARVVEVEIGLLNGFPVAQLTNLQVDVMIHSEG